MNNNQEIWRSMDEYPAYVFSNTGKAYSYKSKQFIGAKSGEYIRVTLRDGVNEKRGYYLSRIIYYLFGDEPELLPYRQVDHIEREEKTNNNISNLRLASPVENCANKGKHSTHNGKQCSSEYVGVSWDKESQKWKTSINVGKLINLGKYKHETNSAYVYNRVASCFKPSNFWFNTLPDDFELPNEDENREYKISQKIAKIKDYLGNE